MKNALHTTTRSLTLSTAARAARAALAVPFLLLATADSARADLGDQLDNILNRTTAARDRATAARDKAEEARDKVNELTARVQDGVLQLTGQVRDAISESAQTARALIEQQFAGRDVFVSQHAEQFRAQLVAFLTDLQTLQQELKSLAGSSCLPSIDPDRDPLSALISLVEMAPVGVLYPVWKGVDLPECLIDDLHDGVNSIATIRSVLGGLDGILGLDVDVSTIFAQTDPISLDAELLAARVSASRVYLEHYSQLSLAVGQIEKLALTFKLLGSGLESAGETNMEGTLGLHGYALIKVESNPKKAMGGTLKSVSDVLGKITGFVKGQLDEAKDVSALNLIVQQQSAILANQQAILEAVSH